MKGFPSIFHAVETNNKSILRLWVTYGGEVNPIYGPKKTPHLAYAITHAEKLEKDTTLMVATLLSLGADSNVIPSGFYTPFCRDLPDEGFEKDSLKDLTDENKRWCTKKSQVKLTRTANLTQRYFLDRAANLKKPSERQRMVARRRKA